MKSTINNFLILLMFLVNLGCDEDRFLEEIPKDFLSPEIAYVTQNDFEAAVLNLYALTRNEFFTSDN
ncbi:MAG: RagB/SusD family nutrient uptake outer membrane protein, partial [Cyclobacteriaceae bacterium]